MLDAVADAMVVAPVEEGQVLSGSYGWGSDAVVVVAGEVRATFPAVSNEPKRARTHRAGAVVQRIPVGCLCVYVCVCLSWLFRF